MGTTTKHRKQGRRSKDQKIWRNKRDIFFSLVLTIEEKE
jgi:hypothetical protein